MAEPFQEDAYIRGWLGPLGWQIGERSKRGDWWENRAGDKLSQKEALALARETEVAQTGALAKKYPDSKKKR